MSIQQPSRRASIPTALLALAGLVAVAVGIPLLLALLIGNPLPAHLPSITQLQGALTNGDIADTTLLKAFAIVAWLAWAQLLTAAALELLAARRQQPGAPHVRLLNPSQRLAYHLVAGLVVVLAAIATRPAPSPALNPRPVALVIREPQPQPIT